MTLTPLHYCLLRHVPEMQPASESAATTVADDAKAAWAELVEAQMVRFSVGDGRWVWTARGRMTVNQQQKVIA